MQPYWPYLLTFSSGLFIAAFAFFLKWNADRRATAAEQRATRAEQNWRDHQQMTTLMERVADQLQQMALITKELADQRDRLGRLEEKMTFWFQMVDRNMAPFLKRSES